MCCSVVIIKQAIVNFFSDIKEELRCTLLIRCIAGTIAFVFFSAAIKYLPLAIFVILFNSAPFFTVIFVYFWTGDMILPFEGLALVCSFAGVICIGLAKPDDLEE